eukprot:TRINITY_DN91756_c0_g1_i1.p1 TRINITY_DN91756_c0_g1~~TRINITY_DN91756_c0_g1_i1.p1  ORF type:complete len:165 (+),score=43.97 TRINITY_DN91756_c0_g1_i1:26-520(+)
MVVPGDRKRRPGASEAAVAKEVDTLLLEEIRLPASTMLYSQAFPDADALPVGPHDFHLCHACAARSESRIAQCKLQKASRVLASVSADGKADACGCNAMGEPDWSLRQELLEEAEARGLDGVLLTGRCLVLLQPAEQAFLIDDDKREGLAQQLLTDMFTKMSLK